MARRPGHAVTSAGGRCALCGRRVPELSEHHLVPRSRGGRDTEGVCPDCHRMVHVLFDNRTLAHELSALEAIRAHPDFARYLRWIRRRPGDRRYRARRPRGARRRRR